LKEYKNTYGTTVLSAEHCQGKFKHLSQFLNYWGAERAKQGNSIQHLRSIPESNIGRLETLGFLTEETVSTHRAKWASDFSLLQKYEELHGTCAVSKCNNEGRNEKLQTFYQHQSRQFRKYDEDPSFSTLDEDQYNRLKNVGLSKDLQRPGEVDEIHDEEPSSEENCDDSQHPIKSDPIKSEDPDDFPIESEHVIPATLRPSFFLD
jgi:hypothetical protein